VQETILEDSMEHQAKASQEAEINLSQPYHVCSRDCGTYCRKSAASALTVS